MRLLVAFKAKFHGGPLNGVEKRLEAEVFTYRHSYDVETFWCTDSGEEYTDTETKTYLYTLINKDKKKLTYVPDASMVSR